MDINYTGIALVLAAIGGLASPALSVATFIRQGRAEKKLTDVHELVNGVSHDLAIANGKIAFNAGVKSGIDAERASPMVPRNGNNVKNP